MDFPTTLSDEEGGRVFIKSLTTSRAELYENLVYYFKYATSAYSPVCPRPNGNSLIVEISNPLTDIQGFIARDKTRKEIVLSLRGSASVADVLMDASIVLVPFISPGVKMPRKYRPIDGHTFYSFIDEAGSLVHSGFLLAWDSISSEVLLAIGTQLAMHEDHTVVTTGHSLGGSLALLAAISLQQNFKDAKIRTYSYGAPRTGNKIFSDYVNTTFGENAYRVVHGNDGVPTAIPGRLGYHHHGVEYWQHTSPPSNKTTLKCDPEGEDPNGSASIPSQGVNLAHTMYFEILVGTPFCL